MGEREREREKKMKEKKQGEVEVEVKKREREKRKQGASTRARRVAPEHRKIRIALLPRRHRRTSRNDARKRPRGVEGREIEFGEIEFLGTGEGVFVVVVFWACVSLVRFFSPKEKKNFLDFSNLQSSLRSPLTSVAVQERRVGPVELRPDGRDEEHGDAGAVFRGSKNLRRRELLRRVEAVLERRLAQERGRLRRLQVHPVERKD